MDPLALVSIVCKSALIISVVTAIAVGWPNRGSRNLALATSTFCGIALGFITQLDFELQAATTNDLILTEFGVDRAKPEIRQWIYTPGSASGRPSAEVGASSWLAKQNPQAFSENREKVTHDMVLFSLAFFLQTPEAQYWDVRKHSLVGKQSGGVMRFYPSPNRWCTIVTPTELESHLARAGNLFAGAGPGWFSLNICLPPSSALEITSESLVIHNQVCEISFTIESSGGVDFMNPEFREGFVKLPNGKLRFETQGQEVVKLENGQSRFETRVTGLDIKIRFFGIRIGQRDSDKYRQWSSALVNGAREWFEK